MYEEEEMEVAMEATGALLKHLWEAWDEGATDLYNVNVPLGIGVSDIPSLLGSQPVA